MIANLPIGNEAAFEFVISYPLMRQLLDVILSDKKSALEQETIVSNVQAAHYRLNNYCALLLLYSRLAIKVNIEIIASGLRLFND